MQFDINHMVVLNSLTEQEADGLLEFLADEKLRHIECVRKARLGMLTKPLIAPIYESSVVRHQEDIRGIDVTVGEISARRNSV